MSKCLRELEITVLCTVISNANVQSSGQINLYTMDINTHNEM